MTARQSLLPAGFLVLLYISHMKKILQIYLNPLIMAKDPSEPLTKRIASVSNFVTFNVAIMDLIGLIELGVLGSTTLLLLSILNFTTLSIYHMIEIRRLKKEIARVEAEIRQKLEELTRL